MVVVIYSEQNCKIRQEYLVLTNAYIPTYKYTRKIIYKSRMRQKQCSFSFEFEFLFLRELFISLLFLSFNRLLFQISQLQTSIALIIGGVAERDDASHCRTSTSSYSSSCDRCCRHWNLNWYGNGKFRELRLNPTSAGHGRFTRTSGGSRAGTGQRWFSGAHRSVCG